MILNVYAYFNKLLEAFGNAQYDDHTPEQVMVYIQRDLRKNVLEGKVENLRYLDFYILGQFNDETGEYTNDKHLLLDLGAAISGMEAQIKQAGELAKEVSKNGEQQRA